MLRISGIQFHSTHDALRNVDKAIDLAGKAVARGANIVAFHQLFHAPWFPSQCNKDNFRYALTRDSEAIHLLRDAARDLRTSLVCPIFEEAKDNKFYNSCLIIDPRGVVVGTYRKTHVPRLPGYEESYYFLPGRELPVFDIGGLKIGIALCWDNFFPEVHRTLALKGADVIIAPTAAGFRSHDRWMISLTAAAITNSMYILRVNRAGKEGNLHFYGDTFCTNPAGELMYEPTGDENAIYLVDIDQAFTHEVREIFPFFGGRRPDIYGELTSNSLALPTISPAPEPKKKAAQGV